MTGVQIRWRKRPFGAHWLLDGVPGCVGSIGGRWGGAGATAYSWAVYRGRSAREGELVALGVAATLAEAQRRAARAAERAGRQGAQSRRVT